ncbi:MULTISPECIES: bifunctional hydroxymethylpyrimidine kinase/phosphomethylpyrimidine kinase, partial [unclassified Corynebacterium]
MTHVYPLGTRPSQPLPVARVLSIAGTDPTGGAGLHADLKAISAAGGYGMAVTTAIVSQNTQGVDSIFTPPAQVLRDQLASVAADVDIDAVKIGMLGTPETIDIVREFIATLGSTPVVLDPVMVATSGDRLLEKKAEAAILDLAGRVDCVTPNLKELAVLCGLSPEEEATDVDQAVAMAQGWAQRTGTTVIVKGGHLRDNRADNAVVDGTGLIHRVSCPRVATKNTHGTGCSLSSALATRLGQGEGLAAGLEWSTRWLHEAIANADALAVGRGHGPVDHGHR